MLVYFLGLCLVGCGGLPPGMKLLRLEIEHAGETVVETLLDARDTSSVDEIWEAAGEPPFSGRLLDPVSIQPGVDPLKMELKGPVRIRIWHAEQLEASVELAGLCLQRTVRDEDNWFLSEDAVLRAQEAARASSTATPEED